MSNISQPFIIPPNRKRFPFVIVAGVLIIWVMISPITTSLKQFTEEDYYNAIIFGIYIALFIPVLIITIGSLLDYVKTLFDKKARLTISEDGIYDNLSIFSCGQINWAEIKDVQINKTLNTNFLILKLKNPDPFISKQRFYKRRVITKYLKKFGSPIVISQQRINYDLHKVKQIILDAQNG